jgi:hypothetical protein
VAPWKAASTAADSADQPRASCHAGEHGGEAKSNTQVIRAEVIACFCCGRDMLYRGHGGDDNGRFCSVRCRELFDSGFPPYEPVNLRKLFATRWRVTAGGDPGHMPAPMRMGPAGFFINCAGCKKQFESKGLRCCSKECERRARDQQDNAKDMAEVGMEPAAKRICEADGCVRPIPRWRNGRAVSKAARFCGGPGCSRKARKAPECQPEGFDTGNDDLSRMEWGAAEGSEQTLDDRWSDFPPADDGGTA